MSGGLQPGAEAARQRRLAALVAAEHAERLAGAQLEGDAVDLRRSRAVVVEEEVGGVEHRRGCGGRHGSR